MSYDITKSNRLPELAARINEEYRAEANAIKRGITHAIAAGELLLEAKAAVPHGRWAAWLKANTALSERTAQRRMQLAKERPALEAKSATVADLTIRGACELLAKPPEKLSDLVKASWLVPEDGCSLVGLVSTAAGRDYIIITPSDYPEYYFVTHVWRSACRRDGTLTGLRTPARWQELPEAVLSTAGINIANATWEHNPFAGRRDRNPFEGDDAEKAFLECVG
jgi:Protein of unknown function (DUF3102)